MHRFPIHMLEHVDVSRTNLVRPLRSPRLVAPRLDEALTRRRPATPITDVARFAGVPQMGALSVPAKIGPGNRRPTHGPYVDAPRRFPVASLDLSRQDIGLPYGVPRFVNAATLKVISNPPAAPPSSVAIASAIL